MQLFHPGVLHGGETCNSPELEIAFTGTNVNIDWPACRFTLAHADALLGHDITVYQAWGRFKWTDRQKKISPHFETWALKSKN